MKIAIVGLQKKQFIKKLNAEYSDFEIDETHPEMVICYGGDGTLLYGEREYPGIPKILIRNSKVCFLCVGGGDMSILQSVLDDDYFVKEYTKLEAIAHNQHLTALSEVVIGHKRINTALRFTASWHNTSTDEIIADGCIVSTPIGSTGYFNSITRTSFEQGIGIAFNNPVNETPHHIVDDSTEVEVTITRGPGVLAVDNAENVIELTTGDTVQIMASTDKAYIVEPKEDILSED